MGRKKKSLSEKVETEAVAKSGGGLRQKVRKTRVRNKSYVMDLRIHSPASLGYLGIEGIDTAPAMVRLAKVKGLDVIAVTDFYSGEFIDRVTHAAKESPLTVIPGVVIRCSLGDCDDVVLSCLFPESFGREGIEDFLLALKIPRSRFGNKDYVVKCAFDEILKHVEKFDGAVLPSRMDKTPNRLRVIPTLVEEYGFRAFDLAYADSQKYFKERWPKKKFQLFSFSNANALAQVGSRIAKVKMPDSDFSAVRNLVARD
ncbi:hypothetical protein OAO01_00550 [Oligoflexia bacterium]|nr:hypothetical protein [Oligoflexia bacterium]